MQTPSSSPWVAVVTYPLGTWTPSQDRKYIGDGHDVLLQGFHWGSHGGAVDRATNSKKSWYRILADNAAAVRSAGFTWVWFPPASDSLAPQGYIPRKWNVLNTPYGSEDELKTAIRALEPVKALADVVLNHRVGVATGGADFAEPAFPDNRAAIARDDESGVGTGNWDTGERHPAGRDLDHTNPDVRQAIKNYLHRLRAVGFQGWRYDLVKGYNGKFVAEYNEATTPDFSVGECFDGNRQKVTDWLNAAEGKTTAFDFPTRFLLYEACLKEDYHGLRSMNGGRVVPGGLIGYWPSRSVTFLDNHDTEYRRELEANHYGARHFAGKTVEQGYAYLLTHPGIPCVFWPHYFDWSAATRHTIDVLIRIRKGMGIHARSHVDVKEARHGLYAAIIDGKVAMKIGPSGWSPGGGWHLGVHGDRFAVWTRS
jgi:alpha-amylase